MDSTTFEVLNRCKLALIDADAELSGFASGDPLTKPTAEVVATKCREAYRRLCDYMLQPAPAAPPANDWRPIDSAPKDASEIEVRLPDGSVLVAHWAEDTSGEEQPSFRAWFQAFRDSQGQVCYYGQLPDTPTGWRPLATKAESEATP